MINETSQAPATTTRALFAVDVENICSTCYPRPRFAAQTIRRVLALGRHRTGDQIVVASNRYLATRLVWLIRDLPHSYLIAGPGPDAADHLLQAAIADYVERFDRLVVATGDGGFTEIVKLARGKGLTADVVANRHSLSRRLGTASNHTIFLT